MHILVQRCLIQVIHLRTSVTISSENECCKEKAYTCTCCYGKNRKPSKKYIVYNSLTFKDSDRREIYVSFYLPNDDPAPHFQWSDIVPGKFIAILFPCIHFFVDKTVGMRVDKASNVYCFDVED